MLEVLNQQIRENERIKGLKVKGEEFKIQAYADDLVIILEEPIMSIETLVETITEYGLSLIHI